MIREQVQSTAVRKIARCVIPIDRACICGCTAAIHYVSIVTCLFWVGCRQSPTTDPHEGPSEADAAKRSVVSVEGLLAHGKFDGDLRDSSPHGHNGEPVERIADYLAPRLRSSSPSIPSKPNSCEVGSGILATRKPTPQHEMLPKSEPS